MAKVVTKSTHCLLCGEDLWGRCCLSLDEELAEKIGQDRAGYLCGNCYLQVWFKLPEIQGHFDVFSCQLVPVRLLKKENQT